MTKQWLDGSELKFEDKVATPVHISDCGKAGTEDQENSDSDTAKPSQTPTQPPEEGKNSQKSAVKDQTETDLQRRGRGRPNRNDTTVY